MNILLLGNGFDLFHYLPTQYHDFLHTVEYIRNNYSEKMQTIGDTFRCLELQSQNAHIKDCYLRHKDSYYKVRLDEKKIKHIIELADSNMWFRYLFKSFNKDIGWIDFEREVSFVLSKFKEFLEVVRLSFASEFAKCSRESRYIIKMFDFFYTKTDRDAIPTGKICEIKEEYQVEYPMGSGNIIVNKEKIIEELFKELRSFATCLALYLDCFVESSLEYIENEEDFVRCEAICSIDKTITFNYTNVFERFYFNTNALHLHGNIKDNIVLGINPDESDNIDSIDTSFVAFKKYYQRAYYETDNDYIGWIRDISKSEEKVNLLIMGHSLDITDKDVIMELVSHSQEIAILYHSETAKASYIENLIRIFGKDEFESVRKNKKLKFMSLSMDFTEFRKVRSDKAFARVVRQIEVDKLNIGKETITII